MIQSIRIEDFLALPQRPVLVDVRTPAEFAHGHIPGACNVPLFSDEERVLVGTTYKQESREAAILLGFDLAGPKWSGFIRHCLELAPDKEVAVHCWRGGMRSGAMAWALDLYGFRVSVIRGGYKQYRRWAHELFAQPFRLCILGGKTGSGKTRLLRAMQHTQQVIDLEELAGHQGSAYGCRDGRPQPSQEQFENNLATKLRDVDPSTTLWLEDECQKIGKRAIPYPLWLQMRAAPMIDLQVTAEQRLDNLEEDYGRLDPGFLTEATERIRKRLGPEQTKTAVTAIREGRIRDFIRIVLVYYDKTYRSGLERRDAGLVFPLELQGKDLRADQALLLNFTARICGDTIPPTV